MEQEISSISYLTNHIEKWAKENQKQGKEVEFHGAFWVVNPDKDFEVEDDRMFAYGSKETLLISLEEMAKNIVNEKEEFVNW